MVSEPSRSRLHRHLRCAEYIESFSDHAYCLTVLQRSRSLHAPAPTCHSIDFGKKVFLPLLVADCRLHSHRQACVAFGGSTGLRIADLSSSGYRGSCDADHWPGNPALDLSRIIPAQRLDRLFSRSWIRRGLAGIRGRHCFGISTASLDRRCGSAAGGRLSSSSR